MKKLMEVKNLVMEKENFKIIQGIDFTVYDGISIFLCGTCGSGKTMLLKSIAGFCKYKGHISKHCKIEVVLDESIFSEETVEKELQFNKLEETEQKIVTKFIKKTSLNKKIDSLDSQTKKLLLLCKSFLKHPKLLLVDNLFSYLDQKTLAKVYSYVKKNKMTLVNVSTNIEEALDYDYMMVLDKGSIAIEGKTLQVLEHEKILKRLGIGLPFYVDLSIQLRLYGLIDKVCLSKEELVGALWK